jgi:hypothetical protein
MCATWSNRVLVSLLLGTLAVLAAVAALLTTRLEHMAAAVGVVGVALVTRLALTPHREGAWLVLVCAAVVVMIVLATVAVVEVDARPKRRLQWWKLSLLLPLVAIAALSPTAEPVAVPDAEGKKPVISVSSGRASPAAGAVAGISIGVTALAASLLLRRRQGGEGGAP